MELEKPNNSLHAVVDSAAPLPSVGWFPCFRWGYMVYLGTRRGSHSIRTRDLLRLQHSPAWTCRNAVASNLTRIHSFSFGSPDSAKLSQLIAVGLGLTDAAAKVRVK